MSENQTSARGRHAHTAGTWPPPQPDPGSRASVVARLTAGMAVVTVVMLAIGLTLTRLDALSGVRAWDARVEVWWFEHRTTTWNTLTHVGSSMSDTVTAVCVTVIAVVVLRLWLGRWYESWVLVVSIGGELLYFLVLTTAVGRQRPDVPHLDAAPPTSSYPSGHVGAAVALYVFLAVVVRRYARTSLGRVAIPTLLCLVPFAVAASRMYRGMHFPTDVLFGAVGGLAWLSVVLAVLLARAPRRLTTWYADRTPPHETEDAARRAGLGSAR